MDTSDSLYRDILGAIDTPLVLLDDRFRIIWANSTARALFSGDGDFTGRRCWEVLRSREEPCAECLAEKALATGKTTLTEAFVVPDGRWFGGTFYPLTGEDGSMRLLKVLWDDSHRRDVENALRTSEQKYRSLVEHSPLWIVETDMVGCVQYINPKASEQSGFSIDEVRGKSILEFIPEDRRLEQMNLMMKGLSGSHNAVHTPLMMKNGDIRTYLNNSAVVGQGTDNARMVVFAIDVTEQAQAQADLRFQMRLEHTASRISSTLASSDDIGQGIASSLAILLEAADVCRVYIFIADDELQSLRKEFEACRPDSPSVHPLGTRFDAAGLDPLKTQLLSGEPVIIEDTAALPQDSPARRILEEDGSRAGLVFPLHTVQGPLGALGFDDTRKTRSWGEQEIRLLRLTSEIITSFLVRSQSEQAEKEALEAAKAADRAKSVFLANMSHEIRTPMTGILGMIDLALQTELSSEQREYLSMAKTSADALLDLLGGILDLAKIEAGKLDLSTQPFHLHEAVEHALRTLSVKAQEKGLRIAALVDTAIPAPLLGDAGRVRQILLNLIDNAIKFTDRGEVVVSVRQVDTANGRARLRFSVADTGPGIAPEKKDHIFDTFGRGSEDYIRRRGGAGLGLAIARHLVEVHGGRLEVDSEPGRGSEFRFTLEFPIDGNAKTVQPVASLIDRTALVVEPFAADREAIAELLSAWGMRVHTASSEDAGIETYLRARSEGRSFDAILVGGDRRPDSGFDLIERLKKEGLSPNRMVLMLHGTRFKDENTRQWTDRNMGLRLLKPIRRASLEKVVRMILDRLTPARPESVKPVGSHDLYLRVLLVEDNPINRKLITALIGHQGWSVNEAADGSAAVEAFRNGVFDIVLMDIQMPGMDGFDATAAIREIEEERGGHIPILAMTAHAMKGDRERCLASGMDDYLPKPIDVKDLVNKARRWGRQRIRDATRLSAPADELPPSLDAQDIRKRLGLEVAQVMDMVRMLIADTPSYVTAIERAVENQDPQALAAAAHRLKGAAGNLGARPLFEACRRLEQHTRNAGIQGVGDFILSVRDELKRLDAFVSQNRSSAD